MPAATYNTQRPTHPARRPAKVRTLSTAEELKPAPGAYDVLREIEQHRGVLTPPKLGRILGLTAHTVTERIRKGDIPAYQLPGSKRWYINPADYAKHFRLHNRSFAGAR